MEGALIIDEGGWSSGMSSEEAELMSQLLGNCSLPNEPAAPFWANPNAAAMYDYNYNSSSSCVAPCTSISQGSSGFSGGGLFPGYENQCYSTTSLTLTNDNVNVMMTDYSTNVAEGDFLNQVAKQLPVVAASHSKKRSRPRLPCDDDEDIGGNYSKEDIKASSSEEEYSNGSIKGGRAPNPNKKLKARATRGSATDPQSLYARKRRERINERLRILQTLVPNGTKVDISTMLEEAVQYVKFLQLQIKVLSSDDMWMYAPIAYNGMDIGLDLRPQSSLS